MKWLGHILILFIFVFSCSDASQPGSTSISNWKDIDVTFENVLEIGSEATTYLSHPRFVVTDSKGNIIVADRGRNQLLVFDQMGDLLHTIGERGPGPGEFREIAGMTINKEDEIIVFDRASQTLKKFNTSGKYLGSINFEYPINSRIYFKKWQSFNFLFYSSLQPRAGENNLLHIYSDNLRLLKEYIAVQELSNLDESVSGVLIRRVGSQIVLDSKLYFTPAVYNGLIYQYVISESSAEIPILKHSQTTRGFAEKIPMEKFKGEQLNYADISATLRTGEKYQMMLYNQSKGLYKLKDNIIAHFTYIENKEGTKRTFGVELYDGEMKRLGYGKILEKEFDNSEMHLLGWDIAWKDDQDRFYIIDVTGDLPKVRVMKLEINKD